jgi:hypothetical protein
MTCGRVSNAGITKLFRFEQTTPQTSAWIQTSCIMNTRGGVLAMAQVLFLTRGQRSEKWWPIQKLEFAEDKFSKWLPCDFVPVSRRSHNVRINPMSSKLIYSTAPCSRLHCGLQRQRLKAKSLPQEKHTVLHYPLAASNHSGKCFP